MATSSLLNVPTKKIGILASDSVVAAAIGGVGIYFFGKWPESIGSATIKGLGFGFGMFVIGLAALWYLHRNAKP